MVQSKFKIKLEQEEKTDSVIVSVLLYVQLFDRLATDLVYIATIEEKDSINPVIRIEEPLGARLVAELAKRAISHDYSDFSWDLQKGQVVE